MPMHNEHVLLLASIIMLDIPQQITLHLGNTEEKNQSLRFVFRMVTNSRPLQPRRLRVR